MGSCEFSDRRHQHHVGTFKPSLGLLDKIRSKVLSPQLIVGVSLSREDYINLPFQPEQRVSLPLHSKIRTLQFEPTNLGKKPQRNPSSTSSSYNTPKRPGSDSPKGKPSGRRHSATTISVLSSVHHANILYAIDLEPANLSTAPQISHIHLGTVIQQASKLSSREADCYIMQLLSGLSYLHSLNITHRDISPSNLLLTSTGVLKIANFASSEHLKVANNLRSSKRCGTIAYTAPEVFVEKRFDGKAVDMWAVGVLYMEMRCGKLLWDLAAEGADDAYDGYLMERIGLWGFRPIENLKNKHCRGVIRSLLEPRPENRMTASHILRSKWCLETELCAAAMGEGPGIS